MSEPLRRSHREVLEQTLALQGARVADIGCGNGRLTRVLAAAGARVTGVEPAAAQLARARDAAAVADEDYVQAGAEALPFPNGTLDIAVFFNSLHHVPVELQGRALDEAARALKPGGVLYVVEPIAEGPHFEVVRPVEDETRVRACAYAALQSAAANGAFEQVSETIYVTAARYADFAEFRDHIVAVNEARRPTVERNEDSLRAAFARLAERNEAGWSLDQPCRLTLLRRRRGTAIRPSPDAANRTPT